VEKPRAASSMGVGRRATYGSRLRILRWHADVVSSSSFRVSLRIFEQKRDCSQSSKFESFAREDTVEQTSGFDYFREVVVSEDLMSQLQTYFA